jgi:tetratricopeptide (TPR) repeat protein
MSRTTGLNIAYAVVMAGAGAIAPGWRRVAWALLVGVLLAGCATAFSRGEVAFRAGHYAEAVREFEAAVAEDARSHASLTALGVARYKLGDFTSARDVLRRVATEDPQRGDARLYLALAELALHDDTQALADLEALRPLVRHPRIAATVERAIGAIREGLSDSARRLTAASLDDAVEWAREVQLASHAHIYALEPSWTMYRDRFYVPLR